MIQFVWFKKLFSKLEGVTFVKYLSKLSLVLIIIMSLVACSSSEKTPKDVSKSFYDISISLISDMEKSIKDKKEFSEETNTKAEQFFVDYFTSHPRFKGDESKITDTENKLAMSIFDVHNSYSISTSSNDKEQIENAGNTAESQLSKVKETLGLK